MRVLRYLFPFLLAAPCLADDFVEWVGPNSGVNWSSGQIQAEGAGVGPDNRPANIAKLMACRAAVVDAQRNLLEAIQGVRVQGTTVVANLMVDSDVIKTSVDGLLQGARIVSRDPHADGSCLVNMTAPLAGGFASSVYGEVFQAEQISFLNDLAPADSLSDLFLRLTGSGLDWLIPGAQAAESGQRKPDWMQAIEKLSVRIDILENLLTTHPAVVEATDTGPTGLVLDARGSNFIPSMSPKIRQLRGGIIYPNKAHQSKLQDRGQLVSLFTRVLDTAKRHPKVGDRPVVMKALRTFGKTRTEIVLGTDSSKKLVALIDQGFLNDTAVIIVL
ncbi:MAG: hypothetical protein QGI25_07565 [Arenicellales bacterium]|jgi:hypothetical protein|nr:hypothetical protein [Arenicellales bacterium]|tara:strand:- start:831 stop:1823 length:993 start_codon:yes stop_codon:yes gene_type:complete